MELLKRFKAGDVQAFETLFRQFQAEVYRWIMQIVRDQGIAEDLTIETFWRVYKSRQHFNPEKSFGAWARRIATNLAIDHIRSRRAEQKLQDHLAAAEKTDAVFSQDIRKKIESAFRRLPPKLQATATLALIEDMSYEEIARALGKPVGAIRTRVFRALRQLRKELELMGISG